MKKHKASIIGMLVAIAAFVGGMLFGKSSVPSASSVREQFGSARTGSFVSSTRMLSGGFGGGAALGAAGGLASGKVLSRDADSITLQLSNGNSEVVFYSTSTSVTKPSPVSVDSINPGADIIVGGTPNSDGSVTAQTIQVRDNGATPQK